METIKVHYVMEIRCFLMEWCFFVLFFKGRHLSIYKVIYKASQIRRKKMQLYFIFKYIISGLLNVPV